MQLKPFLKKANQFLFSGNIFKLFFSYKGDIGRIPYITAFLLLWVIATFCTVGIITYTIAFILVIYCLAALIQKRARSFGGTGTWYILVNILLLFITSLTYDVDLSFLPTIKWIKLIVGGIVIIAHLILALRPSKQNIDEEKRSFLTRIPIVLTILVLIGIFGMFELKDKYMPDTNRPAFHLGVAIGEIYRHTYAYPEFCKAQGYEMVNYPNKVREKFKEEIEIAEKDQLALMERAAGKTYKDIQDFYQNDTGWGTQEDRFEAPSEFFEALREQLIINDIAKEQKIDRDKVRLTEKDFERISLKDACRIFDMDADYFVSVDCPFSYILKYAGKYSNCGTYFNTKGQQ